uniref:Transcription termination factor 2-like n=1 Tax=Phallusia mammillata TaxID=59560 RepID=A0A6F9DW41_9ASCI|nr:transcription termination factor 2-like [Phallusia mammillata]
MYRKRGGKGKRRWGRGNFSGAGLPQWTGLVDENTTPDVNYAPPVDARPTQVSTLSIVDASNSSILFDEIYFGFINASIVGVRYYSGMVSNREMVSLQRQPDNAYDCNAVQVNNVRGQQVGHIKRDLAKAMAPLMDNSMTRVEGLVPRGSDNVYTIPVILSFCGEIEKQEAVVKSLGRCGFQLKSGLPTGGGTGSSAGFTYSQPNSKSFKLSSSQVKNELDSLFENLKEVDQTSEIEQDKVIKTPLFKHQRQALCWMIQRERGSDLPPFWEEIKTLDGKVAFKNTVTNFQSVVEPGRVKGGILADDMGLGKTLVVISLIVGNSCGNQPMFKVTENAMFQSNIGDESQSETTKLDENKTIFVDLTADSTPSADDKRTDKEITPVTVGSSNKAPKYRRRATKRPAKYVDEVMEYDFTEIVLPKKDKKLKTKKKISDDSSDKVYVPPCSMENNQSPKFTPVVENLKPTLIVCPLSVMSNWEGQIKEHLHKSANLEVFIYHGLTKSSKTKQKLSEQHVVITTYQTLAQEFKKSKTRGRLLITDWLRVVLDEGHVIRNPSALQTQACCSLKAERKWVLSGTPIQNSIKDLWTVVSFLGLEPFTDRTWWQRTIERPLRNGEQAAIKRVQCLMGSICIRRTKHQKVNGKPIVDLPTKEIILKKLEMSPEERLLYNQMDAKTKKTISNMIQNGTVMSHYAEVLVILMRLRQICCHPYLAKDAIAELNSGSSVPVSEAKELVSKLIMLLSSGSAEECCVCLDSLSSPVITRCAHIFCKTCISEVILNAMDAAKCPLCRGEVKQDELTEIPATIKDEDEVKGDEVMNPSSKINALMFELMALRDEEPEVCSLVVSQFTSFLRIIAKHLEAKNISYDFFHGGMTSAQRESTLQKFQRGKTSVLLLSLKSGGVGLNLTTASRVFLMEPAWNPAAEEQCFDRVHRLGQTKPVKIVKFVCSKSVEERITDIQSVKRTLAEKSLLKLNHEERQRKRMEDLRQLVNL